MPSPKFAWAAGASQRALGVQWPDRVALYLGANYRRACTAHYQALRQSWQFSVGPAEP